MNDPTLIALRIFQLLFVPMMLCTPLVVVLGMLSWRKEISTSELVRTKFTKLMIVTAVCIVSWLAFLITAFLMRSPLMQLLSTMAWLPFFPLWFLGAMPIAKLLYAETTQEVSDETKKRTASLVNRQLKNPLQWWHWGLSGTVCIGLLVATVCIGKQIDPSAWTPQAAFLWFWGTIGYTLLVILTFAILHFAVRATLAEPEPLDSQGNAELQKLYEEARSNRVLSMFWLVGFMQPVFLGVCLLLSTWIQSHYLIAILGATGGTLLGLAGSWIGVNATLQRLKIARLKVQLESATSK